MDTTRRESGRCQRADERGCCCRRCTCSWPSHTDLQLLGRWRYFLITNAWGERPSWQGRAIAKLTLWTRCLSGGESWSGFALWLEKKWATGGGKRQSVTVVVVDVGFSGERLSDLQFHEEIGELDRASFQKPPAPVSHCVDKSFTVQPLSKVKWTFCCLKKVVLVNLVQMRKRAHRYHRELQLLNYCNPGNFRQRLIFVFFVNSWNLWKLIAH